MKPRGSLGGSSKDGYRLLDMEAAQTALLDWDRETASFMQSSLWGRFKARTGWRAFLLVPGDSAPSPSETLLVLVRPLAAGFSFAYIPHGPALLSPQVEAEPILAGIGQALAGILGPRLVFVRFDLPQDSEELPESSMLFPASRLKRGRAVQVPDTVVLDLGKGEEEILAAMKPKWRYNIRLAEKKGVAVSREGLKALDVFFDLYKETARRDGIAIHSRSYYETLLRLGSEPEFSGTDISLWVARHEGQALAAIITMFHRGKATYLYGASSDEKRNLMPAYALQWEAIKAAKAWGCVEYDFFGIPASEDPSDPMAGLYRFKTGFGGKILRRLGSIDYPCLPLVHRVFSWVESFRLYWFKSIKKRLSRARREKVRQEGISADQPEEKTLPKKE